MRSSAASAIAAPVPQPKRRLAIALLVGVGLFSIVAPGMGQTFTWTGAQNANWGVGANWVGGVAPSGTGGENLVFPNGAANLATNNILNNATFNSITINGSGYTLSNKAITLGAGGLADSSAAGTNSISFAVSFAATRTVTVSNAGTTLTISGVISGAGGLTKSGAGTVVLSAANTYTGVTTINAGAIAIAADAGLGSAPGAASPGKIVFGGGTLRTTATFTLAANRGIALTGAGTISTDPATTLTYGGIIAGPGSLTKTGTGTLLLSGVNTYTGATAVNAGTLRLGTTNAIGSASAVTVAAGATFDLAGFSDVIGSLAGAGTVTSTAPGTVALTSGGNNSSTAFTGVIQNGSGTVGLTKTGTGTLTLSGTNTYSGTTTVSTGTLLVNGTQATSPVSVNGGTLGGAGTVGAITTTAAGGSVSPGQVGPGILSSGNVNWSTGAPSFVVQLNGTTAGTGYDQLNVTGTVNLSGATLSGTMGFTPPTGSTFAIITNDGSDAIVGTFAGLPEGSTVVFSGQAFKISYVGGTGNDVVLSAAKPNLAMSNSVAPSGTSPPGTDLTYTLSVTNNGGDNATSVVVVDTLAPTVQFKVGSVANTLPAGVTVVVAYSNNGGSTWTYVPATGACSAPASYDRCVNRVRWTFQNPVSATAPNNTATLQFIAQIR
ncbi:MAG TPA: autotransporter-associated beta strand repeat-containing protein [Gemmatimonadales bacterium]|nr:autotransporter-associated beta strand repeat-containing protein [Gemmatimonadales bacterium]